MFSYSQRNHSLFHFEIKATKDSKVSFVAYSGVFNINSERISELSSTSIVNLERAFV